VGEDKRGKAVLVLIRHHVMKMYGGLEAKCKLETNKSYKSKLKVKTYSIYVISFYLFLS
jgi:hypothetical protein